MKKTRRLFVLIGKPEDVQIVLGNLQFKGTITLTDQCINEAAISDVFSNNKSVITDSMHMSLKNNAINISIVNGNIPTNTETYYIDISLGNIVSQFERIAEKTYSDIGDHKSNSSGLNGIPTKADCAYCRYIRNNFDNRCIYSSKHFFVMPTLGQFIKGYLLIIPYRHVMSMAEFTKEELGDFVQVLDDIKCILKQTYNCSNLLVWENGTGNGGIGKAKDSVVHAHIHIAPSNLNVGTIERLSGFNFTEIETKDLSSYGKHSYLLLQHDDNLWKINDNSNLYIPRQYIRQLLAEEYGIPDEQWNWREYPFRQLIQETKNDIIQSVHSNWDSLSKRIQDNTIDFLL